VVEAGGPFTLPAGRGSVLELNQIYMKKADVPILRSLRGILKNADLEAYKKYLAVKYR